MEGASWRWAAIQDRVLVAARANGLAAIDGPCLSIESQDALNDQLSAARALGFDGKWAIHPAQIEPITRAFSPSEGEIAAAHETLAALTEAQERGDGAAARGGTMVDEASRVAALAILERTGEQEAL